MPASDANVELHLKTSPSADVLVIYDDMMSDSQKLERRAFYLFANEERIRHGKRPEFMPLSEARHLEQVPIFQKTPAGAVTNELYAVEITARHFQLESRDHVVTEFSLPEFHNWFTAKKVFLFPAAVGADAIGFGAIGALNSPAFVEDAINERMARRH